MARTVTNTVTKLVGRGRPPAAGTARSYEYNIKTACDALNLAIRAATKNGFRVTLNQAVVEEGDIPTFVVVAPTIKERGASRKLVATVDGEDSEG
jgi:hypothetical protein